jgi:hypothetical protein
MVDDAWFKDASVLTVSAAIKQMSSGIRSMAGPVDENSVPKPYLADNMYLVIRFY